MHDFVLDDEGPGPPFAALWFLQYLAYHPDGVSFSAAELCRRGCAPTASPTSSVEILIPEITKVVLSRRGRDHDRTSPPARRRDHPAGDPPRRRAARRGPGRGARLRRVPTWPRAGATTPRCCSPRSPPGPAGSASAPGCSTSGGAAPAGIAMLAASLDALSDGRFVLGLGAGSPQLAEGLHDQHFHSPVARLEAVTRQVRALLAGERTTPSLRRRAPTAAAGRRAPTGHAGPPRRARARRRPARRRDRRRLVPVPAAPVRSRRRAGAAARGRGAGRTGRCRWSAPACRWRSRRIPATARAVAAAGSRPT